MPNPEASSLPENFWQKSCDDDPKFAFEQYVSMYHSCFKPATSPSPYGDGVSSYFHRECVRECRERLGKRTTNEVRAGSATKKVDDMLELGLRLITGTQIKFNEAEGVSILEEIMKGDYPEGKKAIAAGLACQNMQRKLLMGESAGFDISKAVALAEISARFKLFSHTCLNLIMLFSRESDPNFLKFLDNLDLMEEYKKFREETGVQLPRSRRCANCDKQPEKRRMLKSCGGLCLPEKKPMYCSRECQKADWPKHRKWCKIEIVESDEEWTTDSEHDFFEEYTDEEEDPPKKSEDTKKKHKAD